MRSTIALLAIILTSAAADAQCPSGQGQCAAPAGVTVMQAQPMPAYMIRQAPTAWVEYRLSAPPPVVAYYYTAPPAATMLYAAPTVEYRYGPLGRLRRVVVR